MAMPGSELRFEGTLESFFYERVGGAQGRRSSQLPPEVEAYLVRMLADHVRRTSVTGRSSGPLALQYLAAREQQGSRRAQALRAVGDRALFIAGVVPHSIDRTPVDLGYVRSIGSSAYRQIREPAVFHRLADTFEVAAEVISEATDSCGEGDLLGLYERWKKYGDVRDEQRLRAAGVVVVRGRRDDEMQ
jgi:hypothetical protein